MHERLHGGTFLSNPNYTTLCPITGKKLTANHVTLCIHSENHTNVYISLSGASKLLSELDSEEYTNLSKSDRTPKSIIGELRTVKQYADGSCPMCNRPPEFTEVISFRHSAKQPYLHFECVDKFIEVLETIFEDYRDEIVAGSL